jgi:superfamily II DNA or RNA helicase
VTRRLYDFQLHDADAIEAALRSYQSVLYCLPTGGGKTTVADELTRRETERGGSVLFLADRQELVRQAHDRIGGRVVMGSYRPTPDADRPDNPRVTIASVATLARRTEGPDATLVFADEAHLYAASSFSRVLSAYRDSGARVVGLTATPARLDGQGLGTLFDTVVQGPSAETLIANHYLSPVVHKAPTGAWWESVRLASGDFDTQGLEAAGGAVLKDISARWAALGGILRPTLVFAPTKQYAHRLADEFSMLLFLHGLPPAEVITDDTPAAVRRSVRDRIQSGALRVAITVGVLGTGFDAPAVSCIVMARPTLSWSLYLQQGGRGMRTWPGKENLLLIDCAGNSLRHGYLTKPFAVDLDGVRRKHRRATAALTTCRKCWRVYEWTLSACPECSEPKPRGAERRVREVDGELVELTGAEIWAERAKTDDKVRKLAAWIREGQERRWDQKAPLMRFKGLFHRWPRSVEISQARKLLAGEAA